jgi:hypothetical protein
MLHIMDAQHSNKNVARLQLAFLLAGALRLALGQLRLVRQAHHLRRLHLETSDTFDRDKLCGSEQADRRKL